MAISRIIADHGTPPLAATLTMDTGIAAAATMIMTTPGQDSLRFFRWR